MSVASGSPAYVVHPHRASTNGARARYGVHPAVEAGMAMGWAIPIASAVAQFVAQMSSRNPEAAVRRGRLRRSRSLGGPTRARPAGPRWVARVRRAMHRVPPSDARGSRCRSSGVWAEPVEQQDGQDVAPVSGAVSDVDCHGHEVQGDLLPVGDDGNVWPRGSAALRARSSIRIGLPPLLRMTRTVVPSMASWPSFGRGRRPAASRSARR